MRRSRVVFASLPEGAQRWKELGKQTIQAFRIVIPLNSKACHSERQRRISFSCVNQYEMSVLYTRHVREAKAMIQALPSRDHCNPR